MSDPADVPQRASAAPLPSLPEVESPPAAEVLDRVPSTADVVENAQSVDEIVREQPTVDELLRRGW
jgi:hypothetical protein